MPNSILDDIGFSDTQTPAIDTSGGDPAVWTLLGEAGKDPQGQLAVASTIANRANAGKTDYGQVVTDPSQGYEAWQDPKARAQTQQNYPIGSDAYNQAAEVLSNLKSGKVQPLSYTHFQSPSGQAAKGRSEPDWAKGLTGTDIGGNRFYTIGGKTAGSVLDSQGFGDSKVDPNEAAQLAIDSETGKDNPNFPVYDPYNHVGRNADGSIAFIGGNPADVTKNAKQDAADTAADPTHSLHLTIGAQPDTNPDRIAQWLKDHPNDLANSKTPVGAATPDSLPEAAGVGQGLANVKNSIEGLAAPFSQGIRNDLVQGLLNRENNDQNLGSNTNYNLGKFGGELAATAPILAIPGAGELAEGALAGSKFAPAAEFLGGNAIGNPLVRGLSMGTRGALQGGEAGALTSAGNNNSLGENVGLGAATGAILNPLIEGGSNAVGNLLTGGPTAGVTPAIASLAKLADEKYGISGLRVSQIKGVGDRSAATADSELIGRDAAHAANNAQQKSDFTRAIAKTFGSDADRLTPDVMQSAKDRIGGVMNDIGGRTDITDTNGLLTNLHSIVSDASQVVPEAELKPLLNQIKSISDTIQGDPASGEKLSGQSYQDLIAKGSPLDRATLSPNSNIRHYAQQIRNALDDAVEAEAAPEDVSALRQARLQYKNMMTVKNLAAKANVEGEISPGLLSGAVNTNFKNNAFQGAGDLGELSMIGKTFMKEPPNSFTTDRLMDRLKKLGPSFLGGAGIASIGPAIAHPTEAAKVAASLLAGAAVKGGASAAKSVSNLSPTVRNNFLDNVLGGSSGIPSATPVNPLVPAGAIFTNNMFAQTPQQKGTK